MLPCHCYYRCKCWFVWSSGSHCVSSNRQTLSVVVRPSVDLSHVPTRVCASVKAVQVEYFLRVRGFPIPCFYQIMFSLGWFYELLNVALGTGNAGWRGEESIDHLSPPLTDKGPRWSRPSPVPLPSTPTVRPVPDHGLLRPQSQDPPSLYPLVDTSLLPHIPIHVHEDTFRTRASTPPPRLTLEVSKVFPTGVSRPPGEEYSGSRRGGRGSRRRTSTPPPVAGRSRSLLGSFPVLPPTSTPSFLL